MRTLLLVIVYLGAIIAPVTGQVIPTQLICEWSPGQFPAKALVAPMDTRSLAPGIDLLSYPDAKTAAAALVRLRGSGRVHHVSYNYRVTPRAVPNDPLYVRQDNLARAGYPRAWDVTTGGTTPNGQAIVVAVLDGGFAADHEDLAPNLWRNPAETPGDGLDNDNNGLTDDVHGWNYASASPDFNVDSHGTAVAGLIGAAGNNGLGVSGTNWDARLMLLQIGTVADIIAAYDYVIRQRQIFNDTGGRSGAFVVATNASFGIEGATCADFPTWGGMYDRLGAVGILTAASVANVAEDIDTFGDMPTDCPSEFLLGVNNVDLDDRLYSSSGYGRVSIDLAAPGEGSFTTRPGNTYGAFGSTSAAAPYVTGAIALLYATDCPRLQRRSMADPREAALLVRTALLTSVSVRPGLVARTATGGIIDVAAAQMALLEACSEGGETAFRVLSAFPHPTGGPLEVATDLSVLPADARVVVYDALGRRVLFPPLHTLSGSPARFAVDLSELPAGYYLLNIRAGTQQTTFPAVVF